MSKSERAINPFLYQSCEIKDFILLAILLRERDQFFNEITKQ